MIRNAKLVVHNHNWTIGDTMRERAPVTADRSYLDWLSRKLANAGFGFIFIYSDEKFEGVQTDLDFRRTYFRDSVTWYTYYSHDRDCEVSFPEYMFHGYGFGPVRLYVAAVSDADIVAGNRVYWRRGHNSKHRPPLPAIIVKQHAERVTIRFAEQRQGKTVVDTKVVGISRISKRQLPCRYLGEL